MQNQTPLPLRNDTILGVCEAIGQDFGFNPLYLRLAFIAPLFFQPMATFIAYFALGLVVAATRLLAPNKPVAAPHLATSQQLVMAKAETTDALPIAA